MKTTTFPNLMKEPTGFAAVFSGTAYLHKLVNYLVGNSLVTIIHNKTIVVNEVPAEFRLNADAEKIIKTTVTKYLFMCINFFFLNKSSYCIQSL